VCARDRSRRARDVSKFRYRLALAVLILAAFLASGPVGAGDLDICLDRGRVPSERVAACADAIARDDLDKADRAVAYREQGLAYMELGDHDRALASLEKATWFNRDDEAAWKARADAAVALGDLDGTRLAYRQFLMFHPANQEALQDCADAVVTLASESEFSARGECEGYAGLSSEPEWKVDPEKTARFDPDAVYLIEQVHRSLEVGDRLTAAAAYARAAQLDPDAALCLWDRGPGSDAYILRQYDMLARPDIYVDGRVPRILAELQAALRADPNDADALRERGLLLASVNDWFGVVADLEAALTADPDSVELMVLSTKAHTVLFGKPLLWMHFPNTVRGYFEPAKLRERIERAIALGADDPVSRSAYAEVLDLLSYKNDDPQLIEKEIEEYNRAIELLSTWPDHPLKHVQAFTLYTYRGVAQSRLGDPDGSLDGLNLAIHPPGINQTLLDQICPDP